MPNELQEQVHAEVVATKRRSGWNIRRTLAALSVSPSSYYRWRQAASLRDGGGPSTPPPPVRLYDALPQEKQAVIDYALKYPELRHREMTWRMIDEDVACLSASTIYRILREKTLVCPWRRRTKRSRHDTEKAGRTDEIWATDLKYVRAAHRNYYLISFLDEYSRFIVYYELLRSMDANSVSLAAQAAIDTLPKDADGGLLIKPTIRSDNGSCYISRDFAMVLSENGLVHKKIRPHCPEENGVMERTYRTLGEALPEEDPEDYFQATNEIDQIIGWYNHKRLHSALGYLRPVDYYRGNPVVLHEARRAKLATARHKRKEQNIRLRQLTLPLEPMPQPI